MELITERLVLRPLALADLQTTHEYASDKDTCKYMIFLPNKTIDETAEFLQAVERNWNAEKPMSYEFAICLDGRHIGAISIACESESVGEIGWILNSAYHGRGYCTEAATALVSFAKATLKLSKLVAHCDTRNVASYRVMEKLGMRRVGESNREYFDERGIAREYEYLMDL